MRLVLAVILSMLAITTTRAQATPFVLEGVVLARSGGAPVPFANIAIKRTGTGTAANERGAFILKGAWLPADTLLISSIGFSTARIPLKDIRQNAVYYLDEAVVELPELTITSTSGLQILKEALARIPQNYDTTTVGYRAFYQENVWLGDAELAFIEAVADVYRPFEAERNPNDQIRVVKGRRKDLDYSADPQLYYWLRGTSNGLRAGLAEDLIKYRNRKYSPFNPANFRYYQYDYTETIVDGDTRLLVIDIDSPGKHRKALLRMRVFIDEETYAIVRYTFELTEQGTKRVSRKDKRLGYAIMSKVVHATLDYHRFQYTFEYKQQQGKWYLNRLNRHWEIHVDSKRRGWQDQLWTHDMNFIVTDIDHDPKPITDGDIGASEAPLATMIGSDFRDEFWGDYNFIKGSDTTAVADTVSSSPYDASGEKRYSNRKHGFTRADTLRGMLSPLRSCYDVTFYHLDVDIDIHKHYIQGNNVVRFRVVEPFQEAQIDLYRNMEIERIEFGNVVLPYKREHDAVFITFPERLERGTENAIKIFYHGVPKEPDFSIPMDGGALWERDSVGNVWAQMVCQGSGASLWWPNKDHLSDEPDSMKIRVTVPDGYTEISNGTLTRRTRMDNGRTRYEWSVNYPINNYNVTYNIGKYTHRTDTYIGTDTIALSYYFLEGHERLADSVFNGTPQMLRTFEKHFGPYPFPRDGFALVESIYPMEHQSGVCIGKLTNPSLQVQRLMWHESAHEWWGNAMSVRDMADLWIHEAFATYAELIMLEDEYGAEYRGDVLADELNAMRGEEPIIGVYDVNHIHYDIADMYSKGALVLQTLRSIINDDRKWTNLLRAIQDEFRYTTLNTPELVAFVNRYLGADYTSFFRQYLYHTELPVLHLDLRQRGDHVTVRFKWSADVAEFSMPVRIMKDDDSFEWIHPTGSWQSVTVKHVFVDDIEADEENFLMTVDYTAYE